MILFLFSNVQLCNELRVPHCFYYLPHSTIKILPGRDVGEIEGSSLRSRDQ